MKKTYNVAIEKRELFALMESQKELREIEEKEREERKEKEKARLEKVKKQKSTAKTKKAKKEKTTNLYELNKKTMEEETQETTELYNENMLGLEEIKKQLDNELTNNDYIENIYAVLVKYLIDNNLPQTKENMEKDVINALFTNNQAYTDKIIKKVIFVYYNTYSNSLIEWKEIKNQVYIDLLDRKKDIIIEYMYYYIKFYTMTACRNAIHNAKVQKLTYKEDTQILEFLDNAKNDGIFTYDMSFGDAYVNELIDNLQKVISERQKTILNLRVKEFTSQEIAKLIGVSKRTVEREVVAIQKQCELLM